MKEYNEKELAEYNGKDGKPSYLAYEGKVYDVSSSFLWKDGKHQVLHTAGADLTTAMKMAPHGSEFLKKFPVVGTLHVLRNSE
jgi:predicted heme/steroid binding protein